MKRMKFPYLTISTYREKTVLKGVDQDGFRSVQGEMKILCINSHRFSRTKDEKIFNLIFYKLPSI